MQWIIVALSIIIAFNGLQYIFYPLWRAHLDRRLLDVAPNALRLYGLIYLAISVLILVYVYFVK